MSDFRPIVWCNMIYKIISLIMAYRLKAVLPQEIEQNQCDFIQGRLLHENVLLVTELVKDYHNPPVLSRSTSNLTSPKPLILWIGHLWRQHLELCSNHSEFETYILVMFVCVIRRYNYLILIANNHVCLSGVSRHTPKKLVGLVSACQIFTDTRKRKK